MSSLRQEDLAVSLSQEYNCEYSIALEIVFKHPETLLDCDTLEHKESREQRELRRERWRKWRVKHGRRPNQFYKTS